MLKATELKKLKALFGNDTTKIINAIKAEEEVDIEIPEITTFTEEQLAERDTNTVSGARAKIFKEGKEAGIEIANKAITKKFNLADVDTKEPDSVIEALNKTVLTGDTGLKEQVALLQKDNEKLTGEIETQKTHVKAAQTDAELISYFPANRKGLTDKEFLMLTKGSIAIEEVDGVMVAKKDGNIVRHPQTQAPIPVKEVVQTIFNERKWVGEQDNGQGGRGGGDNPGGGSAGIKKFSEAEAQYLKDNPGANPLSPEFQTYVQTIAAATTDFDFDN